jgi:Ca2+-binding RTX toxin-like protein
VTFDHTDTSVTVVDSAAVTPGAGCVRTQSGSPLEVVCRGDRIVAMHATLGDENDSAVVRDVRGSFGSVDLGPGDDSASGAAANQGGPGDDTLNAGPTGAGLAGGPGNDVLNGGPGKYDIADYSDYSARVTADLEGDGDDGGPGERDRISQDVDGLTGGSGDDLLRGNDKRNLINGRGGDDRIEGGGGPDSLDGEVGADVVLGEAGDDFVLGGLDGDSAILDGGPGNDEIRGGSGPDRLTGGPGQDEIDGGRGADVLYADDGRQDQLECRSRGYRRGADVAVIDPLDWPGTCGRIVLARPAVPVLLRSYLSVRTYRGFSIDVGCPPDFHHRCVGSLRVFRRHTSLGTRRFRIKQGEEAELKLRLTRRVRRLRHPNRGLQVRVRTRNARGHRLRFKGLFERAFARGIPFDAY